MHVIDDEILLVIEIKALNRQLIKKLLLFSDLLNSKTIYTYLHSFYFLMILDKVLFYYDLDYNLESLTLLFFLSFCFHFWVFFIVKILLFS
jgi:hypothetical protein